jgi:hypothetical protein
MSAASLGVLETVSAVLPQLQHVRIDEERLAEACRGLQPADLKLPTWELPVVYRADPAGTAGQILLLNAINFCYWGNPKWQIEYAGQSWDGVLGVFGALQRALDEGIPVLDGAFLAGISEDAFEHILRGRGRLHLMPERLAIWREVGTTLVTQFGGRFVELIAAAHGDAVALARLLIERFPSFDDVRTLRGQPVRFYKRAQLATAMLYETLQGQGWGNLAGTENLTIFADYKLPQVLRRMGILIYDAHLAGLVDSQTLIPAGDPREVEIRSATVWAAELMRRALAERMPYVTALHVDYFLWYAGQTQDSSMQPYHRTLTTAY